MGKRAATASDSYLARLQDVFTGTGRSAAVELAGAFSISLWGGVSTVRLVRSFDGGVTWLPCALDADGTPAEWTSSAGGLSVNGDAGGEAGVLYALDCTAFTSSTQYRISQ
jgi:hypothetical protein